MFLNTYIGFKYGISEIAETNYHYISIHKTNYNIYFKNKF